MMLWRYLIRSKRTSILWVRHSGIAQILGFDPRKCHDSFDFVLPNQSCLYSPKPFALKRVENASSRNSMYLRRTSVKKAKGQARSSLRAARYVESAPSPMKKDPNHNWTGPAEIEAIITRLERFLSGTGIDRTINKSTRLPKGHDQS